MSGSGTGISKCPGFKRYCTQLAPLGKLCPSCQKLKDAARTLSPERERVIRLGLQEDYLDQIQDLLNEIDRLRDLKDNAGRAATRAAATKE